MNPWSVDDVADGIYAAIKMPLKDRHQRHAKHWRYVSQHTVKYWAQVIAVDAVVAVGLAAGARQMSTVAGRIRLQLHATSVCVMSGNPELFMNLFCPQCACSCLYLA